MTPTAHLNQVLNHLLPTNPHNLPSHCIIQYFAFDFERKLFADVGDAGVYQLAGEDER